MDYTRTQPKTPEEKAEAGFLVADVFTYHEWTDEQKDAGREVRESIGDAFLSIMKNVPPSPSRTRALNHLIDARMLANAAITHGGKY